MTKIGMRSARSCSRSMYCGQSTISPMRRGTLRKKGVRSLPGGDHCSIHMNHETAGLESLCVCCLRAGSRPYDRRSRRPRGNQAIAHRAAGTREHRSASFSCEWLCSDPASLAQNIAICSGRAFHCRLRPGPGTRVSKDSSNQPVPASKRRCETCNTWERTSSGARLVRL